MRFPLFSQIKSILPCLAFALGASACSDGPNDWVSIPLVEIDSATLMAMVRDDVSTREVPKKGARFALASLERSSSNSKRLTATLMDDKSACLFRITYLATETPEPNSIAEKTAAAGESFPGAPGASASLFSTSSLDSVLSSPAYSIEARGPDCVQHIRRGELAKLLNSVPNPLTEKKAFGVALSELVAAAGKEPSANIDQTSRFILVGRESETKGSILFTFLERSTGCEWTITKNPETSIFTPRTISPASCISELAAADRIAELARAEASHIPKETTP